MSICPSYDAVERDIRARTHAAVEGFQAQIKSNIERQSKELDALFNATREFLTTGVARLDRGEHISLQVHGTGWGQRGFSWSQYFRSLAKEHRRPFVRYGTYYRWKHNGVHTNNWLDMPQRRYLEPLIGAFLIAPPSIVTTHHNTVDWRFGFIGDAGRELFDTWLVQCRENPAFRRALKLDYPLQVTGR